MKDIQMILCTALGKDMEYAGEVMCFVLRAWGEALGFLAQRIRPLAL